MVVSGGSSLEDARRKVYEEIGKIECENLFYRNDIAHKALEEYGKNH